MREEEYITTSTKREAADRAGSFVIKVLIGVFLALLLIFLGCIAAAHIILRFQKDELEHVPSDFVDVLPDDEFTTVKEGDKTAGELIQEMQSDNDLSSILKDWATNTPENAIMHDSSVTNILLLGIDETGGNSDVIMMVSVNEKTHQIFLTSFMRDSYTYIEAPNGSSYAKVNAAYGNGGAACLVQTIENDYKIRVDHYVSVNFRSFSAVVDAIGGVTVPVKQYEAQAMENLYTWGDAVTLNGEQALMYCRIRYCDADGDVSRTRRQRTLISSLIDRCRDLSVSQMTDVVSTLLKYVKTDCPTTKILSYGTKAISNKWYDFDLISLTMPTPDFRLDYMGYAWVWIVDYPPAAQYLQTTIYGESNIKLNPDRVSAIDVMRRRQTGEARP